jgi:NTE family protein
MTRPKKATAKPDGDRPKIGVVLGGGGLKALASIALFKFLDQQGLKPDFIAGCSAGALVAAMRGAGFSIDRMQEIAFEMANPELFANINVPAVLGIAGLPGCQFNNDSGFMNPAPVRALYRKWFGDLQLQHLRPKTILTATDIVEGEAAILKSGPVADAVYASGALWPLFPPAHFEGRLLIDGGYSLPLPIYEAIKDGMDIIIAMIFDEKPNPHPKSFAECLTNQVNTMLRSLSRSQTALAIDMHHYETILIQFTMEPPDGISEASVPFVLETGRRMVSKNATAILHAVEHFKAGTAA